MGIFARLQQRSRQRPFFHRTKTVTSRFRLCLETLEGRCLPSTYVVDTTADELDAPQVGTFQWAVPGPDNKLSLREAILAANQDPGSEIKFDMPTSDPGYHAGAWTISLATALPAITGLGTIIDGTTQPAALGTFVSQVILDGTNARDPHTGKQGQLGLVVTDPFVVGMPGSDRGGHSVIRGLVLRNFSSAAIMLFGGGGSLIENNLVSGTNFLLTLGNPGAISISNSPDNVIRGNVVSSNMINGIGLADSPSNTDFLGETSVNNRVVGNSIVSNRGFGVAIGASGNTVGGADPSDRNLISGNGVTQVYLLDSSNSVVEGNWIGLREDGMAVVPNRAFGIQISNTSSDNQILSNVISGNGRSGLWVRGPRNLIQDNFIGTTPDGVAAIPNGENGIVIAAPSAQNSVIGNLVSGNGQLGLVIAGQGASGNIVTQNMIGTDVTGTVALPNRGQAGLAIADAPGNVIGGTAPGAGNIVAGNTGVGLGIAGSASTGNLVEGNFIGVGSQGTPLGNGLFGVFVGHFFQALGSPSGNEIGGTDSGAGNTIAYNAAAGVTVLSGVRNAILGNSIFANARLGIDLGANGVTPNGGTAPRSGPNNLQNYPVLFDQVNPDSSQLLQGKLVSAPNSTFRLEFFANSMPDPSGFGQGKSFLGSMYVTTDTAGISQFTYAAPNSATYVTATATDAAGNTSEFSAAAPVFVAGSLVKLQMGISNTSGVSNDITLFNPPDSSSPFVQTVPVKITNNSAIPLRLTLGVDPPSAATLSQTNIDLPAHASATFTVTPTADSRQVNDVHIVAKLLGAVNVADLPMTIVSVLPPPVRNADTPAGMADRIPPRVMTTLPVVVTPNLGSSGLSVTLALTGQGANNGSVSFTGAAALKMTGSKSIGLTGGAQTDATVHVASITSIAATGMGYKVGQVVSVAGGVFSAAAQIQILAVSGSGGVVAARVWGAGRYTSPPANPASVKRTSGSGAQFNLNWAGFAGDLHLVVQVRGANTVESGGFTVSAIPVNFRQTAVKVLAAGVLQFGYAWQSDSGNLADLDMVWIGLYVTYSDGGIHTGASRPWLADDPDPTILPTRNKFIGKAGALTDTLTPPGGPPKAGPADSYTATQHFGFHDLRSDNRPDDGTLGWQFDLLAPVDVERFVENIGSALQPHWQYLIIKNGSTNTADLQ